MSIERLKHMKETLMSCVESQMYNLNEVDAEELGEVVDMIKDLSEAVYYCEIVEAMKKEGGGENQQSPPMYYRENPRDTGGNDRVRYYSGGGGNGVGNSSNGGSSSGNNSGGSSGGSYYTEREYPFAYNDSREGRSPKSRRMYMEAKETNQDKQTQMRELERYMQELAQDVTEMIEGASPEERQYLSKKISALATKLNQSNG